ncbi:unnamed protein product [Sphagnum jensenii]|uniref:PsbP C-terminal domain-containing protein n=1 Tax=Sphagnum jensenii TaxID=128206 RepID=A0ABP0ZYP9_9BRYO
MASIAASPLCTLGSSSSAGMWGSVNFQVAYVPLLPKGAGNIVRFGDGGIRCGQASESSACQNQPLQRRKMMSQALFSLCLSTLPLPAIATTEVDATAAFKLYEDSGDKFSLLVPQEWSKGEGLASGQRKVTAFFPVDDSFTNVNVVITGLGADYTSLGSFGTADAFAENLVNSLDRSWKKPPGQAAKLINSRSREGMYYVEYTIERPGERKRHLLSVVGIGSNGWVNRLYTVSGQFWEEDADKYKPSLEKIISSFKLI